MCWPVLLVCTTPCCLLRFWGPLPCCWALAPGAGRGCPGMGLLGPCWASRVARAVLHTLSFLPASLIPPQLPPPRQFLANWPQVLPGPLDRSHPWGWRCCLARVSQRMGQNVLGRLALEVSRREWPAGSSPRGGRCY